MKHPISAAQCRAARGLLGWSQEDLAGEAGLSTSTIATFETGRRTPYDRTLNDIRETFEIAGIEFGTGDEATVKLKKKLKGKRP